MYDKRNAESLTNARIIRNRKGAKLSRKDVLLINRVAAMVEPKAKLVKFHARRKSMAWNFEGQIFNFNLNTMWTVRHDDGSKEFIIADESPILKG